MEIQAPAKLNLFLDILGKRPDGYHEIRTVMQAVNLCDTIALQERGRGISLACRGLDAPEGPANLVWQAAELFFRETGLDVGVTIELIKRIPAQRGLGGGSSDAAATLKGLDRLFGTGLPEEALMGMAAQLGSDVPFFIEGGTALCEGRGERVTPISCDHEFHYTLVIPPFGLSTRAVYDDLTRNDLTPPHGGATILTKAMNRGDGPSLGSCLSNRLERPSFRLCPRLQSIKEELAALGFLGVLMSGSGTALFGLAPSMSTAESLAASIARQELGNVLAVRTARHG